MWPAILALNCLTYGLRGSHQTPQLYLNSWTKESFLMQSLLIHCGSPIFWHQMCKVCLPVLEIWISQVTKRLHQQYRDVFRKQDFLLIIWTMKKQNKATFRNSRRHSIKLHIQHWGRRLDQSWSWGHNCKGNQWVDREPPTK